MILERQTSGLVKQKVFIFLETLVEILKIIWDIFQKQMNFNLVWFPPTVTFPPLRKSQCVGRGRGSKDLNILQMSLEHRPKKEKPFLLQRTWEGEGRTLRAEGEGALSHTRESGSRWPDDGGSGRL